MAGNWNSGRRPNPTKLQMLRGNPGGLQLNPREPEPPVAPAAFDTPPGELADDAEAIKEWRRVVPMLRASGMITAAERSALIALTVEWSRYLQCQAHLREHGMVVTGASGGRVTNPHIKFGDLALKQCQRLWVELGLTPSSRTRLTTLAANAPAVASRWAADL